jgi:CRP-like cAMP-binding protein
MFSACSADQLEEIAKLAQPRQARAGEELIRQGEPGDEFFVIASGTATVTRDAHDVATLGEGSFFGELALFDPAPRNATVTATTAVSTIALSRDAFQQVLTDIPTIRDGLLRGMARRLHDLDGEA